MLQEEGVWPLIRDVSLGSGKWQPHATQLSSPPYVRECALGDESAGLTPKVCVNTPKFLYGGLSVLLNSLMVPKMEEEVERKGLENLNCIDKGREKIGDSVLA